MNTLSVRPIATADLSAILRINADNRPAVAPLDAAELDRLRALSPAHVVAVDGGGAVLGYMLVFARHSDYDGEEFQYFRTRLREPFLYIDQIAVEPGRQRSGLGRQLYQSLLDLARSRQVEWLCCEVNVVPPNPASLDFHRRLGFIALGNGDTLDGRRVEFLTRNVRFAPK